MSTGRRLRQACQECHSPGKFRPIEVYWRQKRSWLWDLQLLCALCRVHLEELTEGAASGNKRTPRWSLRRRSARSWSRSWQVARAPR